MFAVGALFSLREAVRGLDLRYSDTYLSHCISCLSFPIYEHYCRQQYDTSLCIACIIVNTPYRCDREHHLNTGSNNKGSLRIITVAKSGVLVMLYGHSFPFATVRNSCTQGGCLATCEVFVVGLRDHRPVVLCFVANKTPAP